MKQTGTHAQYLILAGGGLVVAASAGLGAWTRTDGDPTYKELSDLAQEHLIGGFIGLYFAALGWIVLGLVVLAGVLATVPMRGSALVRVAATAAALGGLALAIAGVEHKLPLHAGLRDLVTTMGLGAWLTVGGYVLVAAGCALGPWIPRRRETVGAAS